MNRKKVLIVDRSPFFRRTLKEVIQTSETHVDIAEAESAGEAKAILRNESPDVIFLDIATSEHNGIKFIGSIKQMVQDIRIVVLTSHDSVEYEEASIQNGADYFLSKERSGGLRLLDVIHSAIRQEESA